MTHNPDQDTDPMAEVIEAIRQEHNKIARAAKRAGNRYSESRAWNEAWRRLRELQHQAAALFAESRGWRVAKTDFSPRQLATHCPGRAVPGDYVLRGDDSSGLDHCEYFRHPQRPFRPAAIVAHLYSRDFKAHAAWAASRGLLAERLPVSWYYPGHALAVVYTPWPQH